MFLKNKMMYPNRMLGLGWGEALNDIIYTENKIRKPRLEITLNFDAKIGKYVRWIFKSETNNYLVCWLQNEIINLEGKKWQKKLNITFKN